MKKYISIDIGGTAIKYGIIAEGGIIQNRNEMPTQAQQGGPAVLCKVAGIVRQACQIEEVSGICISTAGMVDIRKGEIFYAAPLIPQYAGISYKQTLEAQFSIPCEVENDVNCAGLAEAVSGAGTGCSPMLMLTVGTGIGGSLVIDGQVYHGFGYSACEVGYMHMRGSDFQTLGSASSLTKKVASRRQEPEEAWSGWRIFEEAKRGNRACIEAIDEMVDVLGLGIANICYVVSPKAVVLGGGIMIQEEYLGDKIKAAVGRYLVGSMASRIRLAFAKHQNDAGMLGAYYHFKNCQ